jgi:hypothetical protein
LQFRVHHQGIQPFVDTHYAPILSRDYSGYHAPDKMVLNAQHIILIEPLTPGSTLAKLIDQENQK